ncbi:MAG: tRNA (N6-threonylcarbamoyladenosine(37)-N6)-methyltransferase TrmO [Candidatus Hodarchaeota archaeon]
MSKSSAFELKAIGIVESSGPTSEISVFPEYCSGLQSLVEFSHAIILYWFHLRDSREERSVLSVIPKKHPGAPPVGVFASRSPSRPNPIGLCVAKIIGVVNCTLTVKGLDAFEGSPIVDIKPYLSGNDAVLGTRAPEWALHKSPT